jgi:hypothetical protein
VALIAAAGAGAAVVARDVADTRANQPQLDASTPDTGPNQPQLDASTPDTVPSPQDDRTTVYRAPQKSDDDDHDDDHDDDDDDKSADNSSQRLKPAPPSTDYNGGQTQKTPGNTSKSS